MQLHAFLDIDVPYIYIIFSIGGGGRGDGGFDQRRVDQGKTKKIREKEWDLFDTSLPNDTSSPKRPLKCLAVSIYSFHFHSQIKKLL